MSTRSTIIVFDGHKYHTVYCHFDGYLDHHLPILTRHYASPDKALELVAGGDLSTLDRQCDRPAGHSACRPAPGRSVYYYRDCRQPWPESKPRVFSHWPDRRDLEVDQSFEYLFDGHKWQHRRA